MKTDFPIHLLRNKVIRRIVKQFKMSEIRFFFHSHPFPNSLKVIKDFFLSIGIRCKGLKIPKEKITELTYPFIAHFDNPNEFISVNGRHKDNFLITDERNVNTKCSLDNFLNRWNGVILAFDFRSKLRPSTKWTLLKNITFIGFNKLISIILFILVLLPLFLSLHRFSMLSFLPIVFVILSLYASYSLIKLENDKSTSLDNKICNANKSFDCEKVLKDKISKPFNLVSLAELGFFILLFFYFLICNFLLRDMNLVRMISYFCLLISPFSLFLILYQLFKIKRICPFCTIIHLSILLCGILYFFNSYKLEFISYSNISIYINSLLLSLLTTYAINLYYSKMSLKEKVLVPYNILKQNNIVVKSLLNQSRQFLNNQNLEIKLKEGYPKIILALNLKCDHCYTAFIEYKHILETMPKVGLSIIFTVYPDTVNEIGGFIEKVYALYKVKDSNWLEQIDNWYSNPKYRKIDSFLSFKKEKLDKYIEWCNVNNIIISPTIIIDNQFWPEGFSITDLSSYLRINYS